jgi:prepilin-type N-terminal cleavage/methylation domain-containing protein
VKWVEGEGGFTMIEMIVVCLLLSVVLAGVTTVMIGGGHAQLQNSNRLLAQQTARSAVDGLRTDVRTACAANVSGSTKLVLAYVPAGGSTQCGADSTYTKVIWCALSSPTVTGKYALYRSTASDSSCTAGNGALKGDSLTTNAVFSTGATITVEQRQTIGITFPVSFKQGTYGAQYTLAQSLVLRNGAYQTTSSTTSCSTTDNTICTPQLCPFNGPACYPPVIK